MHLLHAIPDSSLGGAGILLETLLAHLDPARFRVTVVTPRANRRATAYAALGARVCLCDTMPDRALYAPDVPVFRELCRQIAPDVVHTHGWPAFRLGARLAPGRKPLLNSKHCALQLPAYPGLYRWMTDRTVATSQEAAALLVRAGIPVREVVCIPNVPDTPGILPGMRERTRARLGIGPEVFVVGVCARLEKVKGHDSLLACAVRLREAPVCFILVGDGQERTRLQQEVCKQNLTKTVLFVGKAADPAPYYAAMDAHLSCSLGSETSSLALQEGMAAGLPTASSDIPGNRAVLGEGGVLFPPGDGAGMAAAVLRLMAEREGQAARSLAVAARRSAAGMAAAYETLYEEMQSGFDKTRSL